MKGSVSGSSRRSISSSEAESSVDLLGLAG